jgi:hypothetical protein
LNKTLKKFALVGLVAVFGLTSLAYADSVSMHLTGVGNGTVLGGVYVNPYNATVNGTPTVVICDDFAAHSYVDETWTANVSTFADLGSTKWGAGMAQQYYQAAWLTLQLLAPGINTTDQSYISFAIWSLFTPSALDGLAKEQLQGINAWVTSAKSQNLNAGMFSDFVVYTPDASKAFMVGGNLIPSTEPPQEFIARVPEASALALLLTTLGATLFAAFLFRRRMVLSID